MILSRQRRGWAILWSEVLAGYGRRIWKSVCVILLFFLCFGLVHILSRQPVSVEATGYAALLAAAFGAVLLAFDLRRYAENCRRVRMMTSRPDCLQEELPKSADALEEAYQELVRELCRQNSALKDVSEREHRELTDYFTLWTHQIKTPISAMRLLLQNDGGEHADALALELFQIEQYTDMTLQYLRLGSPANDLVLNRYSLDDIVRQALRKYARVFIGRKIAVDFRETDLQVLTDEKWMVFVVEQILSNALKYTDRGTVSICAQGEELVIEDTGIGIRAEDLPRIFEKGYTGFNGRMDKKATGLGLYLCRMVCDRLGCAIRVESEPKVGTKVKILFLTKV